MTHSHLRHEFVTSVPNELEHAVLYVSMPYATAIHLCACGCGAEVVTPISPSDWQLQYDGESVTLTPSIGNWRLPCRSHYWIRRNRIIWAGDARLGPITHVEQPMAHADEPGRISLIGRLITRIRSLIQRR